MLQYEIFPTVDTVDPDLPQLVLSEDAQAFATFPDFVNVVHPEYIFSDGKKALNRATGLLGTTGNDDNPNALVLSTFPNGSTCFDILGSLVGQPSGNTAIAYSTLATPVPAREFSVAFVIVKEGTANSTISILSSSNGTTGNPRVLFNTAQRLAVTDGTTFRAQDTLTSNPTPTLYVVTYSNGVGSKIYRNGVLVSSNNVSFDVETAVLTTLFACSANAVSGLTTLLLSAGYHTSIDLSLPQHSTKLAAITNYMTQKYLS